MVAQSREALELVTNEDETVLTLENLECSSQPGNSARKAIEKKGFVNGHVLLEEEACMPLRFGVGGEPMRRVGWQLAGSCKAIAATCTSEGEQKRQ